VRTHPTRAALTAAALCSVLVLPGCTTETPGNPSAMSTPAAPPSGDSTSAPEVTKPLDGSKFSADPCSTLNAVQLTGFGISNPGKKSSDNAGTTCHWDSGSAGATTGVAVIFTPSVTTGLSNAYALNAAGTYRGGYFVPVEVSGYPAAYNSLADDRSAGMCSLTVGISDQSIFSVFIQGRAGTDGCKAAENVAEAVLQTMQGGQ
jgi:hypothetical protein